MDGKIYCEEEVCFNPQPTHSTPEGIPYRDLSNLALYTEEGEVVDMMEIAKAGPFVATGTAPCLSYVNKEHWESPVRIKPIIEYSFEYPYGGPALVWLRSEAAFYKINSAAPAYMMYWEPIMEAANVAGHVVNILLNSHVNQGISTTIRKIAALSHWTVPKVVELVAKHRKFIFGQIKSQKSTKLLRSSLTKALSSSTSWEPARQQVLSTLKFHCPTPAPLTCAAPLSPTRPSSSAVDDILPDEEPSPLPVVRHVNRSLVSASSPTSLTSFKTALSLESRGSNATPIGRSPIRVAGQESKRRGKRACYDAIGVDSSLVRLRLPSISDTMFACPFCGVCVFRGEEPSVVTKLADHIKAIHLNREYPPQLWCNEALHDKGSGDKEACGGVFGGRAAWTTKQLISNLIPPDEILNSLGRHSLSLTKFEEWDKSRAAPVSPTSSGCLETVVGGQFEVVHSKPSVNPAPLRPIKLLPRPSGRLLTMAAFCDQGKGNSAKDCMHEGDLIATPEKQLKVIMKREIPSSMCCPDPGDSFRMNSSSFKITALSPPPDSDQLHSLKDRRGSTLARPPSEQRASHVAQARSSASEKLPLQFNPHPKHPVPDATRPPKKSKHCLSPEKKHHAAASWPPQERQAIPKGAFSPTAPISDLMHLESSGSLTLDADNVPMNPIPVSLQALPLLFKSHPVETPSSVVRHTNTPAAGSRVRAGNGKLLDAIAIEDNFDVTHIDGHKTSSPASRHATTLGLGKAKRVGSTDGLDTPDAVSSALNIRSKDYTANLDSGAASQTSVGIPGEDAPYANGLLRRVGPMKGAIPVQLDVAPILRGTLSPSSEEQPIHKLVRLTAVIDDATAGSSKPGTASEVASKAAASKRFLQLLPVDASAIQSNRPAVQNHHQAPHDRVSKAVSVVDYPLPSAGGTMVENRAEAAALTASNPSDKCAQANANPKRIDHPTRPGNLADSELIHADEIAAGKVCKEAPSSPPLETAEECCWRCGIVMSYGARICLRCSAVQG